MGIYLCFGLHPRFLISNFLERIWTSFFTEYDVKTSVERT
jgi:hypothetical protein